MLLVLLKILNNVDASMGILGLGQTKGGNPGKWPWHVTAGEVLATLLNAAVGTKRKHP
jgi:hypothetical protein